MRVLLSHQMGELLLELVNDEDSLGSVAELDESLKDAASVVLVAELSILLSNSIDALLHDSVLLLARHLLLLHEPSVVGALHKVKRVVSL